MVSWNEAAEMKDSLCSDAFVMPSSSVLAVAGLGRLPLAVALPSVSSLSLIADSSSFDTILPSARSESPGSAIFTLLDSRSFSRRNRNLSTTSSGRNVLSPGFSTFTLRSI